MATTVPKPRAFQWSALLLGFGLGGFFDGILLHQILQWHHLLSLVEGAGDIRAQVVFDGLFHLLMYLIAAAGLVLLWRGRAALSAPGAGRLLLGGVLVGFGVWHCIDAVLSHWVLGIHRIRIDSPNPLLWDLGWLLAFGLVPLVVGATLRRGGGRGGGLSRPAAALGLGLVVVAAGGWAARSPGDAETAVVVFRPGVSQGAAVNAIQAAGGRLLWTSRGVWAVRWDGEARSAALYRGGAMLVSDSFLAAGCLAWSRA